MTKLPALTMLFLIILAPFSIADDVPDPEDDTITPSGAFQQPPPQHIFNIYKNTRIMDD